MPDDTLDFGILSLASPVEFICGVWKFVHKPSGRSHCRSLPGHLLQLVLKGNYRIRTNRREYTIRPGDMIYYHETEEVEWLGNRKTAVFLSVGFTAPTLAPLPLDRRVFPSDDVMRKAFHALYAAAQLPSRTERSLKIFSSLLALLGRIEEKKLGFSKTPEKGCETWWSVEERIRRTRQFRPALDDLADLACCSRAGIVRSCRRATGESPMRRIQHLRMEEARGLLKYSTLNVTQVAEYLGYHRLNEFSREYSNYFHHSPKKENQVRQSS
jgi:AraC-like DNA-binding protein